MEEPAEDKKKIVYHNIDQMEISKAQFKKINDTDFEHMYKDFDKGEIRKHKLKEKITPVALLNKKYPKTVSEMNKQKIIFEDEKINETLAYIEKHEKMHKKNLELIKEEKEFKNKQMGDDAKKKKAEVKRNLELKLEEQEKNRIKVEERTMGRLEDYEKRVMAKKEEIRNKNETNNKEYQERHEKNLESVDAKYEEVVERRKNDLFVHYKKRYEAQMKIKGSQVEKKNKNANSMLKANQKFEEKEKERAQLQTRLDSKMREMDKKRVQVIKTKREEFERIVQRRREYLERAIEKKKVKDRLIEDRREEVLIKQRDFMRRNSGMEYYSDKDRNEAR